MKHCAKCDTDKPSEAFAKDASRKDGLMYTCRTCRATYKKAYRKNYAASISEYDAAYKRKRRRKSGVKPRVLLTTEERETYNRDWRRRNAEIVRAHKRKSKKKRRTSQVRATPAWSESEAIRDFYTAARIIRETGDDCEVDHIVPIGGRTVCGLHCLANLQYLSHKDNASKGHNTWPDKP